MQNSSSTSDNHIEIERKFLVKGDFRPFVTHEERIVQAYLVASAERAVRIRIKGEKAYLTIKGASDKNGFARSEFEYEIPVADARELLSLALPGIIDKIRYYVPFAGHIFEVDVFHGTHEGLIIAELELKSETESFARPEWLGEEVTGDERYYNAYLVTHS